MTDDEQLALDDAGIRAAAIALLWCQRPVVLGAPIDNNGAAWWSAQSEMDRRLYLYRARVAVEAWERFMQARGGDDRE